MAADSKAYPGPARPAIQLEQINKTYGHTAVLGGCFSRDQGRRVLHVTRTIRFGKDDPSPYHRRAARRRQRRAPDQWRDDDGKASL